MDRRAFLAASAGLALAPRIGFSEERKLRVSAGRQNLVGAAYPATEVWTYNGLVPGPELRFKQGGRLRLAGVVAGMQERVKMRWPKIRPCTGTASACRTPWTGCRA